MNTAQKIGTGVVAAALVCSAAYGFLIHTQASHFDQFAENPSRYLGENFKDVSVEISNSSIFGREFILNKGDVHFGGSVSFGLKPHANMKMLATSSQPLFNEAIKSADPTLTVDLNYRFIPKVLEFASKPFSARDESAGTALEIGKVSLKALPDMASSSDGNLKFNSANAVFDIQNFALRLSPTEVIQSGSITGRLTSQGSESSNFSAALNGLSTVNGKDTIKIESVSFDIALTKKPSEITQISKIDLQNLSARISGLKSTIESANPQIETHIPNDPEMYDAVTNLLIGDEAAVSRDALERLGNSFLSGDVWLKLNPTVIKTKAYQLNMSGDLRWLPDKPQFASLNLNLLGKEPQIGALVQMFVPRKAYTRVDKNNFEARIVVNKSPDKITVLSNGMQIYTAHNPF
ncbi:hypothetical protein [uncultured Parasutterella sp.]|uniref:hypothetical protein n=3 Tax=uncultured Parasutterella sp. TaxID=1263098 RepID=UPI00272D46A3|nr:hypothetical protein [uncultured Parasutterella sp.]